ncbi:MAG: sugar phosphate isomerase/epimerase [archaeon]|nr:sugar phosphate isomerase/epimerase [archaeon]
MIGISSTGFCSYEIDDIITEISKYFDFWEIFAEAKHHLRVIESKLPALATSFNLKYSLHAPISDINIASFNERIREDSVLEILSTIESAIQLNIDKITIHPGILSISVPCMREKSIAQAKKSLRSIDRISQQYGATVAVENMSSFPFFLGQTSEEIIDLLDGTNLAFCLDIGHANTTNQTESLITDLKDRLVNIHIHDNNGEKDEHLTLGDGNINFKKILSKLKFYEENYIIESKSILSGVKSRDYLKTIL